MSCIPERKYLSTILFVITGEYLSILPSPMTSSASPHWFNIQSQIDTFSTGVWAYITGKYRINLILQKCAFHCTWSVIHCMKLTRFKSRSNHSIYVEINNLALSKIWNVMLICTTYDGHIPSRICIMNTGCWLNRFLLYILIYVLL